MKNIIVTVLLLFSIQVFGADACFEIVQKGSSSYTLKDVNIIYADLVGFPDNSYSLMPGNEKSADVLIASNVGETLCSSKVFYDGNDNVTLFDIKKK